MDLATFLLWLPLNCDPPDLHLMNSWDYKYEPLYLAWFVFLNIFWNNNNNKNRCVILRQAKSRKSSGLIEKYCISD
jgi:hypothetical protein